MAARGIIAMPMGTFSQKIHCQDSPSVTAPPSTGPAATPRPVTPPHTPMAMPRFSAGNASLIKVRVSGRSTAAPAPCTTRAVMSCPGPPARAAAAEARVKTASPTTYMRRRPNRSPSAAPGRVRQAKTRL